MASTTDLGKWMLTNGGEYNPETAYEQLTMVMYENSTYITLKTVQGITPTDDHINYQLMAKGFNPTALASVQAEDTSGVLGEVGGTVSAQDLIDWVVDQAATKLLKISDLVSVQTNDATKGVSAALAYAMNQSIDQLDSNLTRKYYSINSQLSNPILEVYGNICVLQYCNAIWTSSDRIPSGFYPKILSGIWAPVSSSDDLNIANEYRLCIQSNGAVGLQKNGTNVSDNTSIRGQAIWII
mgnify:CR=1 FL=1